MLDIKLIRDNPELVQQRLATRGRGDEARIAEIAVLDEKRRKLATASDGLKAERNKVSKEIGVAKAKGQDAGPAMAAMKQVGDQIAALDQESAAVEAQLQGRAIGHSQSATGDGHDWERGGGQSGSAPLGDQAGVRIPTEATLGDW